MQTQKKYQQVIAAMKREILEGNLEPGAPFMTDMVAVRRYGVSRITVRRAFDQLVREGCLSRTRGRGTVVRAHPGQGEYLFAFPGQSLVGNGIEPSLIMGIEDCLVRHESSLIFCNTANSPPRTTKYVQRSIRTGVDGVIFIPLLDSPDINVGIAETLLKARIPCVAVSRAIPGLEARLGTVLPVSLVIRQSTGINPRMRHAVQTAA
jgi:DNA-binding transcriptional regulator YhcF (GntR family)